MSRSSKSKYAYFLIWGHGLGRSKEVIRQIRDDKNFDILKIKYHDVDNINTFVKQIYSQDYAPLQHLKGKTKYLMNSESRVMIVFVRNKHHHEKIFGNKKEFQHVECAYIKEFKEKIRDQFNPRDDEGNRTHEHIIHASDSEYQVDHLLKLLGYTDGVQTFTKKSNHILPIASTIKPFSKFVIKKVDIDSLYCYLYKGDKKNFHKEKIELSGTPHFKYVMGDTKPYEEYIEEFGGYQLTDDHFAESFDKLEKSFKYLEDDHALDYILVEEFQMGNYMVLDGVHRACLLKKRGDEEVVVAVVKQ